MLHVHQAGVDTNKQTFGSCMRVGFRLTQGTDSCASVYFLGDRRSNNNFTCGTALENYRKTQPCLFRVTDTRIWHVQQFSDIRRR